MNMIVFSRLDGSFPVKVAKNIKIEKKSEMTEYIDIALSDLVLYLSLRTTHPKNLHANLSYRQRKYQFTLVSN